MKEQAKVSKAELQVDERDRFNSNEKQGDL